MKYFYRILFVLFFAAPACFGTHLKGGEIRYTYLSPQTYKISVLLYLDPTSGGGATEAQSTVTVCMGDKNVIEVSRVSMTPLTDSSGIVVGLYEGTYTYPSAGLYQISASINNRTSTLNFPNGMSTPMLLWTTIETQFNNSSPVFPFLHFTAGVRQVFTVDLKPTLPDVDSVSFRLQKLSKTSPGTCSVRRVDSSFVFPNDVSKTGTFGIKQVEKKLVWTAPEQVGVYSYALVADEWRDGIKISESYREGSIFVTDRPGKTVDIPDYVYAGELDGIITSIPKLDSPEISIAIEAYPVPTADYVTVKAYSKQRSIIKLELIDLHGRVLKEFTAKTADIIFQEQFDLRNYSPGIYIIRAGNGLEFTSQKVVR